MSNASTHACRKGTACSVLLLLLAGCVDDAVLARDRDGGPDAATMSDVQRDDGSDAEAPDGSDNEIELEGDLYASSTASNADAPQGFETRFSLTLRFANTPVTGATITFASAGGSITLQGSGDRYSGEQSGYFGNYSLSITSSVVNVSQVPVMGPAAHRFTMPVTESMHPAGQPLMVQWAPFGAASATLETRRFPETPMSDVGIFTVPGTAIVGEPGRVLEDEVRVRRTERVRLPTISQRASIEIEVRNRVHFDIVTN